MFVFLFVFSFCWQQAERLQKTVPIHIQFKSHNHILSAEIMGKLPFCLWDHRAIRIILIKHTWRLIHNTFQIQQGSFESKVDGSFRTKPTHLTQFPSFMSTFWAEPQLVRSRVAVLAAVETLCLYLLHAVWPFGCYFTVITSTGKSSLLCFFFLQLASVTECSVWAESFGSSVQI